MQSFLASGLLAAVWKPLMPSFLALSRASSVEPSSDGQAPHTLGFVHTGREQAERSCGGSIRYSSAIGQMIYLLEWTPFEACLGRFDAKKLGITSRKNPAEVCYAKFLGIDASAGALAAKALHLRVPVSRRLLWTAPIAGSQRWADPQRPKGSRCYDAPGKPLHIRYRG